MSDIKHTKEPWYVLDGYRVSASRYEDVAESFVSDCVALCNELLGGKVAVENTRRIVDCVNACEGMENPAKEIESLRTRIAELTKGEPVSYLRYFSHQYLVNVEVGMDLIEGFEVCDKDDLSVDGSPAFPVFLSAPSVAIPIGKMYKSGDCYDLKVTADFKLYPIGHYDVYVQPPDTAPSIEGYVPEVVVDTGDGVFYSTHNIHAQVINGQWKLQVKIGQIEASKT